MVLTVLGGQHCGKSFQVLIGRQIPAFITHHCLHFSVLCPCCPRCLPLDAQGSLSLLCPLEGVRGRVSGELSTSRWVTNSFLRGCLAPAVSYDLMGSSYTSVFPGENGDVQGCAGCLGVAMPASPSPLLLCLAVALHGHCCPLPTQPFPLGLGPLAHLAAYQLPAWS